MYAIVIMIHVLLIVQVILTIVKVIVMGILLVLVYLLVQMAVQVKKQHRVRAMEILVDIQHVNVRKTAHIVGIRLVSVMMIARTVVIKQQHAAVTMTLVGIKLLLVVVITILVVIKLVVVIRRIVQIVHVMEKIHTQHVHVIIIVK